MRFKNWMESQQLPVMYHGSPTKRTALQAGSMLTTDPVWAAGYTTKMNYSNFQESFVGVVHAVRLNPANGFHVTGSLHQTEDYLIRMGEGLKSGSGLNGLAKAVHQQFGYDALISVFQGSTVGAITLVDVPVAQELDPIQILKQHYPNIPDNLKAMIDRLNANQNPSQM